MQRILAVIGTRAGLRAAVVTIALTLAACGGGGGGGGSPTPPTPPAPNPPTTVAPTIVTQPSNQSIDDGQSASFAVTANGTTPLTYQWRRNDVDIAGATSDSYTITGTYPADNGAQFTVVVTNSAGSATSSAASLSVDPVAPTIATQPLAQSITVGSTATFSVTASGSSPLTYQWRRNGVAVSGATNNSYITGPGSLSDSGALFDVEITNTAGTVVSDAALLTVSTVVIAPTIARRPLDARTPVGGRVAFVVVASGTAPFTYQWHRNGTPIPNATSATHIVAPVSGLNDDDSYTVTVTNAAGSVTSEPGILSVDPYPGQVDLAAGLIGAPGNVDGTGGNAHFRAPSDVAVDSSGNLFITDGTNTTVRKVTAGVTTTLAGVAEQRDYIDAVGVNARFRAIHSIAVDEHDNVYVADGNAIRRIAPDRTVTTVAGVEAAGYADGSGTAARFRLLAAPRRGQLTVGPDGDLFVADCGNHVIRRVTPAGIVSTYAGSAGLTGTADGPVADARFNCPSAIAFDDDAMYVTTNGASARAIRKIEADVVSTVANSSFSGLVDLTVDSAGDVFAIDMKTIKRVTSTGTTTEVVGSTSNPARDGTGTLAGLGSPEGIAIDGEGNLYVADLMAHAIRKISPTFDVSTLPSNLGQSGYTGYVDGTAAAALFNAPMRVTAGDDGTIYVADSLNCAIRAIDGANVVSTLLGEPDGCASTPAIHRPVAITVDGDTVYAAASQSDGYIMAIPAGDVPTIIAGAVGNPGFQDGVGAAAQFSSSIKGLATDGNGNIYVSDSANNAIRKIDIASGTVTTLAGAPQPGHTDGVGTSARFNGPCGIEADAAGNVYVADCGNHAIRKIHPTGGVTTIAGVPLNAGYVDGDATASRFSLPVDLALDDAGNLYVADQVNYLIRKITPEGSVNTVAGATGLQGQALGPLPASMNMPFGIHARNVSASEVELIVTAGNAVVRITLP